MADSTRKFGVIGYALEPKKIQSFIQNSLVNLTKERGIDLVRIDSEKPLIDQGPFDCILHKRYGEEWKKELKEYSFKNPEVVIIDPPDAIERLHKRDTMLQVVKELRIPQENESFGIPKQIVIDESGESLDPSALEDLTFPVIAKPLVANGSAKSHKMFLVFNQDGLNTLKPPIVLQEFVNHGGVIFKVYVVGEFVKCMPRKSLPDISEEKLGCSEGLMSFSHISNLTSQERSDDNYYEMMNLVKPGLPPLNFVADIARGLREAMGLRLFNFDVIRDSRIGNRYFIIDINYFPGYAKMPSYETVLTDFFGNILHQKRQGALGLDKKENTETESDCRKFLSCEKEDIRLVSNSGCTDEDDGPFQYHA